MEEDEIRRSRGEEEEELQTDKYNAAYFCFCSLPLTESIKTRARLPRRSAKTEQRRSGPRAAGKASRRIGSRASADVESED